MANKAKRTSMREDVQDTVLVSEEELRQRRPISVYRVAKFSSARGENLCLIRTISARALTAETCSALIVGERVSFDFGDGPVAATVTALDEAGVAAAFDEPIDVTMSLVAVSAQQRRAAARIGIDTRARLQIANQILFVTARDISQEAIGIETQDILMEGDAVAVALRGWHGAIAGTVTRVDRDTAAIHFLQPIGFGDLAEWLATHGCDRPAPVEFGYERVRP
jgi:hypothetical protein